MDLHRHCQGLLQQRILVHRHCLIIRTGSSLSSLCCCAICRHLRDYKYFLVHAPNTIPHALRSPVEGISLPRRMFCGTLQGLCSYSATGNDKGKCCQGHAKVRGDSLSAAAGAAASEVAAAASWRVRSSCMETRSAMASSGSKLGSTPNSYPSGAAPPAPAAAAAAPYPPPPAQIASQCLLHPNTVSVRHTDSACIQ